MNYPIFIFEAVKYNVRLTKLLKMLDLFSQYEGKALNFRILPQILDINKKTFYRQVSFLKEINAISITETTKRFLKFVKINGFTDIIKKNQSIFENLQSGNLKKDLSNFPSNHLLLQSNKIDNETNREVVMENIKSEINLLKLEEEKQNETGSQINLPVSTGVAQFETESQINSSSTGSIKFCYRFSIRIENQGVSKEIAIANGEADIDFSQIFGDNNIYNNIYNNINSNINNNINNNTNNNNKDTKEALHGPISTKVKNKKEKKEKKEILVLPDWLPIDLWNEFLNMRKTIKKPLTEYGQYLAIKNLEKLKNQGFDIIQIIETSISNCWLGFFPPKQQVGLFSSNNINKTYETKRQFRNKMLERTESAWIDQYLEDIKPIMDDIKEKERQFFGSNGSV